MHWTALILRSGIVMAKAEPKKGEIQKVKKRIVRAKKSVSKKIESQDEYLKDRFAKLESRVTDLRADFEKKLSEVRQGHTSDRVQLRKKYDKELSEVKNKLRAVQSNSTGITILENRLAELAKKVLSKPASTTVMVSEGSPDEEETQAPQHTSQLSISEEELAADIVSLYFEEIARHGFKRTLTLDDIIKTFSYTLKEIRKELAVIKPAPVQVVHKHEPVRTVVEDPGVNVTGYSHRNARGQLYHLHQRGKLFYFSKKPEGSIPLPSGLKVTENTRTGLPMVKRI